MGFIPEREGRDYGVRTLLALQKIEEGKYPGLRLSIDTEKAFHRVDWGFMMNTVEVMGVGPKMIHWIKALYNQPTARVKINEMYNGMRQGCPLSPLLFVLALEPLLAEIRNSPDIGGIKIGHEEHKIATYADDILFYVSRPRITLPNIMNLQKNTMNTFSTG